MAKANRRSRRSSLKQLPQIGSTTEQCKPVEDLFNSLGLRGLLLVNITAFGQNGRNAYASLTETDRKWQYRVVQFNMKDPLNAERQLNLLGEDGWVLHQVYSQGANNFATAAVFIKSAGEVVDEPQAGPEQTQEDSEPSGVANDNEGSGIHVQEGALQAVGS